MKNSDHVNRHEAVKAPLSQTTLPHSTTQHHYHKAPLPHGPTLEFHKVLKQTYPTLSMSKVAMLLKRGWDKQMAAESAPSV